MRKSYIIGLSMKVSDDGKYYIRTVKRYDATKKKNIVSTFIHKCFAAGRAINIDLYLGDDFVRPCPFCGTQAAVYRGDIKSKVCCSNINECVHPSVVMLETGDNSSLERAVKLWNKRA